MKKLLLLVILLMQVLTISADVVKGRVVDADSGEPLWGARIEFFQLGSETAFLLHLTTDSCGVFTMPTGNSMSNVTLKIDYIGYETLQPKTFNVAGGKDTLDIGDLRMKMSDVLLKEVMVEAKAKRFYMRGDTVVFNPEAFNLEDGERVATLLQKLPGVTIDNGKLMFMGKEVHLKMNGHNVADNFLTGELPAEAVKDIKAYEQNSEVAELTGMRDGKEKQILDITIKPGFMDKWYGKVKLGAYASENYLALANTHYLSDNNPFHVYVRASDNGARTDVWNNFFSETDDYDGKIPQRQQLGKVAYEHLWQHQGVKTSYDDSWSANVSLNHNDVYQHNWQTQQTLVSGQPSVFSNTNGYNYDHKLDVPLNFETYLHLDPHTLLQLNLDTKFFKNRNENTTKQQTYRGEEYIEDATNPTNSSSSRYAGDTKGGDFKLEYDLTHVWKERNVFTLTGSLHYLTQEMNGGTVTNINYFDLGTSELREQTNSENLNQFDTDVKAKFDMQIIPEKFKLNLAYRNEYNYSNRDFENTLNGGVDFANSGRHKDKVLQNSAIAELQADLDKWFVSAYINVADVEQKTDYKRGRLDTLARRNYWKPYTNLNLKWKPKKNMDITGNIEWESEMPDFINCMDYIDDTNPLMITMGNPDLSRSSSLESSLQYNLMLTKASQMLSVKVGYKRDFDPVRNAVCYNPATGAYILSYANVNNSDEMSLQTTYDRAFGDLFRFRGFASVAYSKDYSLQTRSSIADPLEQFRQNNLMLFLNPQIGLSTKTWDANLYVRVNYHKADYRDPTMQNLNLWYGYVGLYGRYKLKYWTFFANGRLYSNRGYLSDNMNRERFSLNAEITWKCLKNKGQLTLAANDIFNQMDNYNGSVSATQITESWKETFHRYLSLTFTYNFDAKAKKGK